MVLGGLFKLTGNAPPLGVSAKLAYMAQDLERHAARLGVPMRMNRAFPMNTVPALRGALVAQRQGFFAAYDAAMFRAVWEHDQDISDAAVMESVLAAAGIDEAAITQGAQEEAVKAALKANTDEAAARGAFGAPAMFVGDELFWGNDRLDFVEAALA
jgi:2-hydroxychromene-2-carboxylate isomerase